MVLNINISPWFSPAHIFEKRFNMKAAQESDPPVDKLFCYVVREVSLAAFFFRSLNSTYRCCLHTIWNNDERRP